MESFISKEERELIRSEHALLSPGEWYATIGRRARLRLDICTGPRATDKEIQEALMKRSPIPGLKVIAHTHVLEPNWFEQNENLNDIEFLAKSKDRMIRLLDELDRMEEANGK